MADFSDSNGISGPPVAPPPPPSGSGFPPVPGPESKPPQWYEHPALIVFACLLCWPIGIALVWVKRQWPTRTKWIITAAVIGLGIILGAATAAGSNSSAKEKSASVVTTSTTRLSTTTTTRPATTTTVAPTTTTAPPPPTTSPAPVTAPPETSPPAPAESVSQRNARQKASQYLNYSAFSRSGLISQLEYEGFSNADATYGADAVGADWNQQAAKKAAEYLNYSSFSRSGLVEQLLYEGFSASEAEYGVSTTGL